MATPDIHNIAVFCDFENVALGIKEANYPDFKIQPILERLLLKGSIVVKKAYCDWDRYKEYKRDMHESAFELIEIPHVRQSGKNSADIRMVVDALDLCYTKSHIDAFVIISGDSDFSPLISKLKENGKSVIGIAVRGSASTLLMSNCDEFFYYEELAQIKAPGKKPAAKSAKETPRTSKTRGRRGKAQTDKTPPSEETGATKDDAIELVVNTVEKLLADRGGEGMISASLIKNTIRRIRPGFTEADYGYNAFGKILDDGQKQGSLVVERKEGGAVNVGLPSSKG